MLQQQLQGQKTIHSALIRDSMTSRPGTLVSPPISSLFALGFENDRGRGNQEREEINKTKIHEDDASKDGEKIAHPTT